MSDTPKQVDWSAARTAGQMIEQLSTMPPGTRIGTAHFVETEKSGRFARVSGITASWERITADNRLDYSDESLPKSIILWANADERQADRIQSLEDELCSTRVDMFAATIDRDGLRVQLDAFANENKRLEAELRLAKEALAELAERYEIVAQAKAGDEPLGMSTVRGENTRLTAKLKIAMEALTGIASGLPSPIRADFCLWSIATAKNALAEIEKEEG
jgi:hypothetical protein